MGVLVERFMDLGLAIDRALMLALKDSCGYVVAQECLGRMWVRRAFNHEGGPTMFSTHTNRVSSSKVWPSAKEMTLARYHRDAA